MPQEPIRPVLILEQIIEKLKEDIVLGKISQGEALRETDLQQRFNISRSPIRDALRILEKQGFVQIIQRKGAFVRTLTPRDMRNIYDVRAVLEGLAAKEAKRLDAQIVEKLKVALNRMTQAFEQHSYSDYLKAHDSFHRVWIDGCANPFLIEEALRLHDLSTWYAIYSQFEDMDFRHTIEAHQAILNIFSNPDSRPEDIENCVRNNILSGGERVRKKMVQKT